MKKKKIVIALGHDALGTTLPEQHEACQKASAGESLYWQRTGA